MFSNTEIVQSFLGTGLPEESVDVVLLYNVLPMIKNRHALIEEIYRILRPAGVLSVKRGLVVSLYGGEKIKPKDLESLIIDKYRFTLRKKIGKFRLHVKMC